MSKSRTGLLAVGIVIGIAVATIYLLPEMALSPREVSPPGPSTAADPLTASATDQPSRSPVEIEDARVPVDLDPASWEAAFPPEQRAAVAEYAKRPNAALVLVSVRGFSRGLFDKSIVYITATTLCEVPGRGYEQGGAFDAWVSDESPFQPSVSDDLGIGERRVVLVERVLWKRLILCVSQPVRVSEDAEFEIYDERALLESLPDDAKHLVRPRGHYSVIIARATPWTHPNNAIAKALEHSSSRMLRLALVQTLFSHRADWSPGTTHEARLKTRSGQATAVNLDRLPEPDTAAMFLVRHDLIGHQILYIGTAR